MKDDEITSLKKEINNFIWMYGPKNLTLERAEEIACRILTLFINDDIPAFPTCPNDTDGDGDCHMCWTSGGCNLYNLSKL